MKKFSFFIFSLVLLSCTKQPSFEGVWIGTAYEVDKEVYQPFAFMMHAKPNGDFYAYPLGSSDTSIGNWEIKNEFLQVDTLRLAPSMYNLSEKTFIRSDLYKSYYHKLENPEYFDSLKLKKELINSSWKSKIDECYFNESGELRIQGKDQSLYEKACWEIIQDQGFTFIIKKGNQLDCKGFIRYPERILSFKEDKLLIERWENGGWKTIEYLKSNKKIDDYAPNQLQLCNPYLYRNNPNHRYYYKNTFYKGGIYKINKLFDKFYTPPKNNNENGLLKVEFIVNCEGKPGYYSMLELDENYRERKFSSIISEQLLTFTKTLKDWNAGVTKNGETIDTYRFLTYKIRNGEVVEIFP